MSERAKKRRAASELQLADYYAYVDMALFMMVRGSKTPVCSMKLSIVARVAFLLRKRGAKLGDVIGGRVRLRDLLTARTDDGPDVLGVALAKKAVSKRVAARYSDIIERRAIRDHVKLVVKNAPELRDRLLAELRATVGAETSAG